MLAVKCIIAIAPGYLAAECKGDKAAVAKAGINSLAIRSGSWRGEGVALLLVAWHLPEYFLVPKNSPVLPFQRHHSATRAVLRRSRDEHAVSPEDRRRPGLARNGSF